MKKFFLLLCLFVTSLSSCNKEAAQKPVLLRIENKTHENFTHVLTNGESFDNVNASSVSPYRSFTQILSVPSVMLITETDTAFAGLVFIDYVTYIDEGRYTLQIVEDSLTYSGYNCVYIKE